MEKRKVLIGLAVAMAGMMAGCSALDLGPEPSNEVRGGGAARYPTDAGLEAVKPVVIAAPAEAAVLPATMPSATEPTTTQPAETQAATNPASRPALGQGASEPVRGAVPRELDLQNAILTGLENNTGLRVERFNVPIRRTNEEAARAAFDPALTGTVQGGRTASPSGGGTKYVDSVDGSLGISEFFPTGTNVAASLQSSNSFYSDASSQAGASVTVTQSLLRGFGLDVNLASLREAEIATKTTQYQLRGFAESLVADIETTYWDLAFAERQVVIVQNALDVAEKQLADVTKRVQIEKVAEAELPAAQAEVALRKQDLINAKSNLETTRLRFLQLITPHGQQFWNRPVTLQTPPFVPTGVMDPVDAHASAGLRFRPEMNEAKLDIQRGDLEVVRTKNGLLPRLDLFITLGQTGFASAFGTSFERLNGPDYSAIVGVKGQIDPINRAERASYRAAELTRAQLEETLNNLAQTVQVDVRTQYIEVERTRQQIDATHATRVAQEEALRVEVGKFQNNRSTSLLVAQAHRDLLAAQLNEVQAVTNHLKALVTLYRLEGTLLYRRGIVAPGAQPVEGIAWKK